MNYLKLTPDKLSVEDINDLVASPSCGAISIFCGTTRDNFDGKTVVELEYEAYEKMAVKMMKVICEEMRNKWSSIENIAIYHRLGVVPVKESSVIIAISSPHRGDALQSTQYCIDNLKSRIPIWKKEKYDKSAITPAVWKENKECAWSNIEVKPEPSSEDTVDEDLIQIKASRDEINQRIERFMEQKRHLLNRSNILDFCGTDHNESDENSCARIDAVLVPRKGSKSHLRVRRVYNTQGPQMESQVFPTWKKEYNSPMDERLSNAENHLLLNRPVPSDIYERIKRIEERILELESISPEYCQFWKNLPTASTLPPIQTFLSSKRKRQFSVGDIDKQIDDLQHEIDDSS